MRPSVYLSVSPAQGLRKQSENTQRALRERIKIRVIQSLKLKYCVLFYKKDSFDLCMILTLILQLGNLSLFNEPFSLLLHLNHEERELKVVTIHKLHLKLEF